MEEYNENDGGNKKKNLNYRTQFVCTNFKNRNLVKPSVPKLKYCRKYTDVIRGPFHSRVHYMYLRTNGKDNWAINSACGHFLSFMGISQEMYYFLSEYSNNVFCIILLLI